MPEFVGVPYAPGSDTSQEAAESLVVDAEHLRGVVLSQIVSCGEAGCTTEEIERATGLRHQTASARVNELVKLGLVADSGRRRQNTSRRNAVVLVRATPAPTEKIPREPCEPPGAVYLGDCREVLPRIAGPVPAEGEGWAHACITDPPYHLVSSKGQGRGRGFMGLAWDGGGVAFDPETWRVIGAALRPGAPLLAFGGTRTFHRLACAIEDAGFEIRDTLCWLYGQGWPKAMDISKALDKTAGAAEARRWSGYASTLKPAWEPIILAMKPPDGNFAENALKHGVAGLNIAGCRIPAPEGDREDYGLDGDESAGRHRTVYAAHDATRTPYARPAAGRWPANVTLDEEAGGLLDEQCAGASRFFYCAKASRQERTIGGQVECAHPTVKPLELMRWLVRLVSMPGGSVILDPFMGSGTTGLACLAEGQQFVGIEQSEPYFDLACKRLSDLE